MSVSIPSYGFCDVNRLKHGDTVTFLGGFAGEPMTVETGQVVRSSTNSDTVLIRGFAGESIVFKASILTVKRAGEIIYYNPSE